MDAFTRYRVPTSSVLCCGVTGVIGLTVSIHITGVQLIKLDANTIFKVFWPTVNHLLSHSDTLRDLKKCPTVERPGEMPSF